MQILNYSVAISTRYCVSRFEVEGRRVKMSAQRKEPIAGDWKQRSAKIEDSNKSAIYLSTFAIPVNIYLNWSTGTPIYNDI